MAPASKGSLRSLQTIIENAPVEALAKFLFQEHEDFPIVPSGILTPLSGLEVEGTEDARKAVFEFLKELDPEIVVPLDMEARRAVLLTDGKGPSALKTIAGQKLTNEQYQDAYSQRGELAVALHMHALHRPVFDDAVSFRNARIWRDGKFYSALDVDLDQPMQVTAHEFPNDQFREKVRKRLSLPKDCGISVVDLPENEFHRPSILVILRIPKDITGFAEHGENGGRRLRFLRPQKEAILIYSPGDQRIEICAETAVERAVVADCFAAEVLGHDVSTKPLMWVNYDLSRFFKTLSLESPEIPGFEVQESAVVEIEFRLARWHQRLRLMVPLEDDIVTAAASYLLPARILQRASGIARILIAVRYKPKGSSASNVLEIAISDRNRCNLLSNPDPELRRLGRTLLTEWKIQQPFRDLGKAELGDFLSLMLELHDEDEGSVPATFFSERNIDPERLLEAKLIVRKGVDDVVIEDETEDLPPAKDRAQYAISTAWLEQRIIEAFQAVLSISGKQEITARLFFLGSLLIDEKSVPCYLARGLTDKKWFVDAETHLRARSNVRPGIVFCGKDPGWKFIASNLVMTLSSLSAGETILNSLNSSLVEEFYRANLGLALGGTTLTLVEDADGSSGTLYVPGKPELPLFSEQQVRCFRILVNAKKKGLPGVKTRDLIAESKSTGIQQMLGAKRWPLFRDYIEDLGQSWWALKTA